MLRWKEKKNLSRKRRQKEMIDGKFVFSIKKKKKPEKAGRAFLLYETNRTGKLRLPEIDPFLILRAKRKRAFPHHTRAPQLCEWHETKC